MDSKSQSQAGPERECFSLQAYVIKLVCAPLGIPGLTLLKSAATVAWQNSHGGERRHSRWQELQTIAVIVTTIAVACQLVRKTMHVLSSNSRTRNQQCNSSGGPKIWAPLMPAVVGSLANSASHCAIVIRQDAHPGRTLQAS